MDNYYSHFLNGETERLSEFAEGLILQSKSSNLNEVGELLVQESLDFQVLLKVLDHTASYRRRNPSVWCIKDHKLDPWFN